MGCHRCAVIGCGLYDSQLSRYRELLDNFEKYFCVLVLRLLLFHGLACWGPVCSCHARREDVGWHCVIYHFNRWLHCNKYLILSYT